MVLEVNPDKGQEKLPMEVLVVSQTLVQVVSALFLYSNQTKQEAALPMLLRVPLRVAEVLVILVAGLVVTLGRVTAIPSAETVKL